MEATVDTNKDECRLRSFAFKCIMCMRPEPGAAHEMGTIFLLFSLCPATKSNKKRQKVFLVRMGRDEGKKARGYFSGCPISGGREVEFWKVKNGAKFLSLAVSLEMLGDVDKVGHEPSKLMNLSSSDLRGTRNTLDFFKLDSTCTSLKIHEIW